MNERTERNLRRAAWVAGGAVVGLAAAPVVAPMIGTGLAGAAAMSHGLATIGFGSIAGGGLGMTGGLAVASSVGAVGGGTLKALGELHEWRGR